MRCCGSRRVLCNKLSKTLPAHFLVPLSFSYFVPKRTQRVWRRSQWVLSLEASVDRKRGQRKGATSKKRQKSSKSVKNISDTCRQFSRRAKNFKNRQKWQKHFRHFSTIFARDQFSGPFWGALWKQYPRNSIPALSQNPVVRNNGQDRYIEPVADLEASGSQSEFFADFNFLKNLGANPSMPFGPRCHGGRSHALLEHVGPGGDCVTCFLLEKAEMEWGTPPLAGPLGRRRLFRRFSVHFCVTLEHLFLKRQNLEEKSAENCAKICTKICAPKICARICAPKICTKMGAKLCAKICAPKICAKNWFEHSVFSKMETRKKKTKKICATFVQKTQPPPILRMMLHLQLRTIRRHIPGPFFQTAEPPEKKKNKAGIRISSKRNPHPILGKERTSTPQKQGYPRHQNDYMQLFLFSGINFLMITITITFPNP